MKRRIKLTESDLHRIVNESVRRVIDEIVDNRFDAAEMAGAAQGAAHGSTLGTKLKGWFNPQWKARKQRQADLLAQREKELRAQKIDANEGNPYYGIEKIRQDDMDASEYYNDAWGRPRQIMRSFR